MGSGSQENRASVDADNLILSCISIKAADSRVKILLQADTFDVVIGDSRTAE